MSLLLNKRKRDETSNDSNLIPNDNTSKNSVAMKKKNGDFLDTKQVKIAEAWRYEGVDENGFDLPAGFPYEIREGASADDVLSVNTPVMEDTSLQNIRYIFTDKDGNVTIDLFYPLGKSLYYVEIFLQDDYYKYSQRARDVFSEIATVQEAYDVTIAIR